MLEKLWFKKEVENNLLQNFIFSFSFGMFSIILTGYFLGFKMASVNLNGLVSVFLVSLAASYPMVMFLEKRIKMETNIKKPTEYKFLDRHLKEIFVYLSFFIGITAAFSVSYFIFPGDFFSIQTQTIGSITGGITHGSLFLPILENNLFVFLASFVISFVMSAGMIFILSWNASVLGIFLSKISSGILEVPVMSLLYLPHGLLEISGYVLAGISGFLLSRQFGKSNKFDPLVFKDSLILLFLGIGVLISGVFLETL